MKLRNQKRNRNGKKLRLRILSLGIIVVMVFGFSGVAFAADWYLDDGDISVEAGEGGHNVTQNNTTQWDDTEVVIKQHDNEVPTDHTLTVKGDEDNKAQVTLDGVNVEAKDGQAGIKVEGDAELNLAEGSENKVTGGKNAAGVEVEAVSYTHLDVYKRQGRRQGAKPVAVRLQYAKLVKRTDHIR